MTRPNFFEHLHPPTIPAREAQFRYTFGLGGMSLLLFFVLAITGVPLMFVYVPTTSSAGESIRAITYLAPYGWFLRNLHYWAAALLLLSGSLHLLRVLLTGAYKKPRRFNWLLGLLALLLCLLLSFSGYVLRWDVDTYSALVVGTNIVKQIPLVGNGLYEWLIGGPFISDMTVVRFYTWHTLGLSVPVLLLLGWHLFRVRRDGGISHQPTLKPHPAANEDTAAARLPRRLLVYQEGIVMLALLCLLFGLSLFFDAPLAPPLDQLNAPVVGVTSNTAPWFFLWVQALLRRLPPVTAGILIPFAVALVLALLPWTLDRRETGTAIWFNREGRLAQTVVVLLAGIIILLTFLEWLA